MSANRLAKEKIARMLRERTKASSLGLYQHRTLAQQFEREFLLRNNARLVHGFYSSINLKEEKNK